MELLKLLNLPKNINSFELQYFIKEQEECLQMKIKMIAI